MKHPHPRAQAPIGVFDSGIGGLTVLSALQSALPHEDFIYLGDTARLPYGTKSAAAVQQYTLEAAHFMQTQGVKLMVIACNTATAHALDHTRDALPDLPCIGVIEPGAAATTAHLANSQHNPQHKPTLCVWATEGTVRSGLYETAIRRHAPHARVVMQACNLLVTLAEEGWTEGVEAEAVLKRYLSHLPDDCEALLLGCTHFPLLAPTLRRLLPSGMRLINSADVAAAAVRAYLSETGMDCPDIGQGETDFYVTDAPERFERLSAGFLGRPVQARAVSVGMGEIKADHPNLASR